MAWAVCDGANWVALVMVASGAAGILAVFLIVKEVAVIISKTPGSFQ